MGCDVFNFFTMHPHVAIVTESFEAIGFAFREQSESDYGVDGHADLIVDERPTGRLLGAQIKSGPSYLSHRVDGGAVYREALPRATRIYLTRIDSAFEGDTWFPEVDWRAWRTVERETHAAGSDAPWPYSFEVLARDGTPA